MAIIYLLCYTRRDSQVQLKDDIDASSDISIIGIRLLIQLFAISLLMYKHVYSPYHVFSTSIDCFTKLNSSARSCDLAVFIL